MEDKLSERINPVVKQSGYEVYDLSFDSSNRMVRLSIINLETMNATLDDCVKVDHALTDLFEEDPLLNQDIGLEVSSPGMFRPLKGRNHFEWASGKRVRIDFREKEGSNNVKRVFGVLTAVDSTGFSVDDERSGEVRTVPWELYFRGREEPVH